MWMNTLSFIYVFLPLSLLFYYISPLKLRSVTLIIISAAFIYITDPLLLYFAAFIVTTDFLLIKLGGLTAKNEKLSDISNVIIALSVLKNIGTMVFYYKDKIDRILPLPFIVSCIAVCSCEAVYDYIKTSTTEELGFVDFTLATMFYPKLIMGPVVTVYDFCQKAKTSKPALEDVGLGLVYFIMGMAKKVLLADTAYNIYEQFLKLPQKDYTWFGIIFLALCIMFYTVFTFMAFSDIAKGLALAYSLKLPINTFYPLDSDSVWQFVKRLNLSCYNLLSKYMPNGGRGKVFTRIKFIIMVVFCASYFMGIRANTLCWAAAVWLVIMAEQFVFKFKPGKKYMFIKKMATWFLIVLSFVFFAGENFSTSIYFIKSLFFINPLEFINDKTMYIILSNWVFLLLFVVFSASFWSSGIKKIKKKIPVIFQIVEALTALMLLLLMTVTLV